MVQRHANTGVSFLTTVANYQDGLEMMREYAALQKMAIPPRVTLNKNNVPAMQMILYEVHFVSCGLLKSLAFLSQKLKKSQKIFAEQFLFFSITDMKTVMRAILTESWRNVETGP